MTASQAVLDPLRGATSLWKVTWLYSFVGGAALEILGLLIAPSGDGSARAFALIGLLYGTYVTVAAFRCARNCPWPFLSQLVRLCSAIALFLVPYMAYLILASGVAIVT